MNRPRAVTGFQLSLSQRQKSLQNDGFRTIALTERFIKRVLDLRKDPERGDVGHPVMEVRAVLRWSVSPPFVSRNAPHSSSKSKS